jgi:hypothetical protein
MRDGQNGPQLRLPQPYHFCFVVVTRPEGQYQDTGLELSHPETVSHPGTLPGRSETRQILNLGLGGRQLPCYHHIPKPRRIVRPVTKRLVRRLSAPAKPNRRPTR